MKDRVVASLKSVATGDAIGKQTEGLSREALLRWYPNGVRGFEGPPGDPIPRYVGNKKHEWRIGETTDDTERTTAVARAILADGGVHHESVGRELLKCRKCVHPGIQSLWEFHQAGDPARVAVGQNGCGAAIRIAPVGILYRSDRFEELVHGAVQAALPTHGGTFAIAAAAATAVAVSAAVDGAAPLEIIQLAQRAAAEVELHVAGASEATFAEAVRRIHDDLREWGELAPGEVAARYAPNGPFTIVPLALALGTIMSSAESAILLAANVGGDSDSVASIAGAILGARQPGTVNEEWYRAVEAVNAHDLEWLGEELAGLRR